MWAPPTGAGPGSRTVASWWAQRPWWLLVTLVAIGSTLLFVESIAIEAAFLASPRVGDVMLWVGAPLLSAILGSIVYRGVTGRSVWGERRPRWSDLGWGAAFGGLVMLSDLLLSTLFDLVVSDPGAPVQVWLDGAMAVSPVLVAIGVSIATPLGEEVVFRGPLLRGLEARSARWIAVAGSSLLFGLVHLENVDPAGWLHVTGAAIAGVLFALALLKSGHLLAAVTAHLVVNGTYTVMGFLAAGGLLWTVGPAGDVPDVALDVGQCAHAAWWNGDAIDVDRAVDCETEHDLEIASRGDLPGGRWADATLDDAAVADAADAACLEDFETYVGGVWETSALDYVPLLPDPERWVEGDRELICLVVPYEDDVLTEPARGSGR